MARKKEISPETGTIHWKNPMEYFYERAFLHGFPYHYIVSVDNMNYLVGLDLDNADSYKYKVLNKSEKSSELWEEGMHFYKIISKIYDEHKLAYYRGATVIEKLKEELLKTNDPLVMKWLNLKEDEE
ncbi:MAG: hypothetical protein N2738_06310 [Thermodesulfovibrionales bacterium]|nr:hypothetical protein [Thermodesulfovibrionales bacterium]